MMTALEYLKTKSRMTEACTINCNDCPLSHMAEFGVSCIKLECDEAEKAIEIVEKWAKEHPVKTFLTDFLKKYPNSPMDTNGTPNCCPYDLGYTDKKDCDWDCKKCWNRELKEV